MAQLQSAQSGADQQAEASDRIAAEQEQLALSAKANALQAAGGIRSQDFNVASTIADKTDAAAQFNMQNSIARQRGNVDRANQAQAANLQNAQQLSIANTTQRNAETERQAQAKRTFWQDKMSQAQAEGGMDQANSQRLSNDAANSAQSASNLGGALLGVAGKAYGAYSGSSTPATKSDPLKVDTSVDLNAGGEYDKILKKQVTG
jgi:hypothetical protein